MGLKCLSLIPKTIIHSCFDIVLQLVNILSST